MPDAIAQGTFIKEADDQWFLRDLNISYEKFSVKELCEHIFKDGNQLIAIDAPLICKNETGARPVDRECSDLYRKYEAGCHPVNLNLVKRPLELADELVRRKIKISHEWEPNGMRAIEVYPHPTMIHWFGIEKTIKYKKGKVAEKRLAFRSYQDHLKQWLNNWSVKIESSIEGLLNAGWTKENEDRLDAFFCLLIACWEVMYEGEKSLSLGDDESGFIVIPNNLLASFTKSGRV